MKLWKRLSLQGRILILALAVVFVVIAVLTPLLFAVLGKEAYENAERQALTLAGLLAEERVVRDALAIENRSADLETYIDSLKSIAKVQIVNVFDMQGNRLYRPENTRIGKGSVSYGEREAAWQGKTYVATFDGGSGRTLRAYVPVYSGEHQIGVAMVGILREEVSESMAATYRAFVLAVMAGLSFGTLAAWALARHIKKIMLGLEPETIAGKLAQRNAILDSVREGVIAVDEDGRITLFNDEALRILDLGEMSRPKGGSIDELIPGTGLREIMLAEKTQTDEEIQLCGKTVLANRMPLAVSGRMIGALLTFRDKGEVERLAEELTGVQSYVEALRARGHEFMNRLHVIWGMVQLKRYEALGEYVRFVVESNQREMEDVGVRIMDPLVSGFLLGKMSQARERKVSFFLHPDSELRVLPESMARQWISLLDALLMEAFSLPEREAMGDMVLALWADDGCVSAELEFSAQEIERSYGFLRLTMLMEAHDAMLQRRRPSEGRERITITMPLQEWRNERDSSYDS